MVDVSRARRGAIHHFHAQGVATDAVRMLCCQQLSFWLRDTTSWVHCCPTKTRNSCWCALESRRLPVQRLQVHFRSLWLRPHQYDITVRHETCKRAVENIWLTVGMNVRREGMCAGGHGARVRSVRGQERKENDDGDTIFSTNIALTSVQNKQNDRNGNI